MFSGCVPFSINCCQRLYVQSQPFQVLYTQSWPAFQKPFYLDRFFRRIKRPKEQRKPTYSCFKIGVDPSEENLGFDIESECNK